MRKYGNYTVTSMTQTSKISTRLFDTSLYNIIYTILKVILYFMYNSILTIIIYIDYVYNYTLYNTIYNKKYIVVFYIYCILRYANQSAATFKIHKHTNQLLCIWQQKSNLLYQIHSAR